MEVPPANLSAALSLFLDRYIYYLSKQGIKESARRWFHSNIITGFSCQDCRLCCDKLAVPHPA